MFLKDILAGDIYPGLDKIDPMTEINKEDLIP